jgi:pyruvate formate lyase activating enzyme
VTFKGWQKTSLIEYPGKIATVVFTGGCNFRCPFCYNTELVEHPHKLADVSGPTILRYVEENRSLYQAAVITGGEPTLNEGTPGFLAQIKSLGLYAGLETNGSNPAMIARLLDENLVDYIAMDVKAPLEWTAYRAAAGLQPGQEGLLEEVKRTLQLLQSAEVEVELRCTVVPRIHTPQQILHLARQLRGYPAFVLQQFVPERALEPQLRNLVPFNADVLREIHLQIENLFPRCELRGI